MSRSLAQWDLLVEGRATCLVRVHIAGRRPIADKAERSKVHAARDRAFDALVAAVEGRDRAHARMTKQFAANSRKQAFRSKESATFSRLINGGK